MIRSRLTAAFAGLLMALGGVTAVAHAEDAPKVIRVTYVASPFNIPAIVMREKGYLDEAFAARGIKVESPVITSGAAQIQAIAAGAIDIASVLGDTSAILGKANGVDLQVVAAFSRNPKAFTIMGKAGGPTTLEDLKGKTVAGPKGTTLNQLLAAALASKGMTLSDVKYINMDLAAARAALISGQVDAATLAGSHVPAATKAGAQMIVNGGGLIAPTSVIGVRGEFLRQHRDLVDLYMKAQQKALDFMAAHPEEALEIAAKEQKMSLEDAQGMLPLYDFSPVLTDQDVKNMESSQDFMVKAGMMQQTIDIRRDLIDPAAFASK